MEPFLELLEAFLLGVAVEGDMFTTCAVITFANYPSAVRRSSTIVDRVVRVPHLGQDSAKFFRRQARISGRAPGRPISYPRRFKRIMLARKVLIQSDSVGRPKDGCKHLPRIQCDESDLPRKVCPLRKVTVAGRIERKTFSYFHAAGGKEYVGTRQK